MAVKTKINDYGDCVYAEEDILNLIYQNPELDISKLYVSDVAKYKAALSELGIDLPDIQSEPTHDMDVKQFDQTNTDAWHMPAEYKEINVLQWLLDKCQTDEEKQRVQLEFDLFDKKGFVRVLQFLIYFIDTLRANNVVWGVGRGSSVSSFCLFLIGVHKINPLIYNLDYKEFLR